jgi:transposase
VNVLKPHLQTTVFTLLAAGKSHHEISRITGIDRKTIRRLNQIFVAEQAKSPEVATGSANQIPPPRPPGPIRQSTSACEPHRDFIQAQLGLRRNFTAIYQDLADQFGFSASYNSVKRFAGTLIKHDLAQFDRLEFAAGEEVQVDYGEGAMTRYPGTDRYRRPRLFVMTLRFSRRSFRRVVWNSGQEIWAKLHEQAWRYFGGAATYVVLDNLKEGVIKPDLYEPELNSVYAAVLAHYGVVADPARVANTNVLPATYGRYSASRRISYRQMRRISCEPVSP